MAQTIRISKSNDSSLKFVRMHVDERLGEPFRFKLEMLSQKVDVDLRALLGTPLSVTLATGDGYKRHFHGIVAEAEQTGFQTIDDLRYACYRAVLVPKPWLLTRKADCRIYKDMTVPDIVREVLGDVGYSDVKVSLSANYPKREYCVQYRESCFNFITRLMQEEGIYYFFTHSDNTHTMVLADALGAHATVSGFAKLPYGPPVRGITSKGPSIWDWQTQRDVTTTKCHLTDYDPLQPKASLLTTETNSNTGDTHTVSGLESFDFPGLYDDASVGKRYAQVRVEADNALQHMQRGRTNACGMSTGALVTLQDFPVSAENREYLVVATELQLEGRDYASGGEDTPPFACRFEAISSRQPFRNRATVQRPVIAGLQTAVVAGKTAGDIIVDKYGRVQVTFHWNLPAKPKAQNSCPVRVASTWAGKNWGAVHIPRVGQEVVISFLEGNPDRPLIIGSVYNADNMPPYALPDNKTQSGIKSRSLEGTASDFNELRFEDKKGKEEIYLHAQHDKREEIKNDHIYTVTNDQTGKVQNNRTCEVSKADSLKVGDDGAFDIGKSFQLKAGDQIELVTGSASMVLKSSGEIEIKGTKITIDGSEKVDVKAQNIDVKGEMKLNLQGGMGCTVKGGSSLKMSSDGQTELKGTMLSLSGSAMAKMAASIIKIG